MNKKKLFFIILTIFLLFNRNAFCVPLQQVPSITDRAENEIVNIFNNVNSRFNVYSNFTIRSKTSLYCKENLTICLYNTIDKKLSEFYKRMDMIVI